jgi:hypothetical protein
MHVCRYTNKQMYYFQSKTNRLKYALEALSLALVCVSVERFVTAQIVSGPGATSEFCVLVYDRSAYIASP